MLWAGFYLVTLNNFFMKSNDEDENIAEETPALINKQ
jgi:hypothetical protein